jgi:hypothetical protein
MYKMVVDIEYFYNVSVSIEALVLCHSYYC